MALAPGNITSYNLAPGESLQTLDAKRRIALALSMQGADVSPVQHWTQGAARLAQALVGGYELNKLDEEDEKKRAASARAILGTIIDPQENQPNTIPTAAIAPSPAAPPATPAATTVASADMTPGQRALLKAIAGGEAKSYDMLYGGRKFDSFADHPRTPIPITSGPMAGKYSTAAGLYQFLAPTWDQQRNKLNLPDFSPPNQDIAAWDLAATTYKNKTGGDLKADVENPTKAQAIAAALNGVWPSLPGGSQPNSMTAGFTQRLGTPGVAQALNAPVPQPASPVAPTDLTAAPQMAQATMPGQTNVPTPSASQPLAIRPGSPLPLTSTGGMTAQQLRKMVAPMIASGPAGAAMAQDLIKKWNESNLVPNDAQKSAQYIRQNWRQLGFSGPDDPALAALVRQRLSGLTMPAGETTQEQALGKYYGEMFSKIGTDATNARSSNATLTTMAQLAKSPNFRSGIGAEFETFIKRGISALGGDKALIDLGMDPKKAQPNEAFRALSNKAVIDTLGSLGTGISNADRDFIQQIFPSLANTPEGNAMIVKVMQRMNDRKIEIAQMARGHNKGRLDADFEAKLDDFAAQHPLFSDKEMAELNAAAQAPATTQTPPPGTGIPDRAAIEAEMQRRKLQP